LGQSNADSRVLKKSMKTGIKKEGHKYVTGLFHTKWFTHSKQIVWEYLLLAVI